VGGACRDIEPGCAATPSGAYRLGWLQALIDQDRAARRQIRRLERLTGELSDRHGTAGRRLASHRKQTSAA